MKPFYKGLLHLSVSLLLLHVLSFPCLGQSKTVNDISQSWTSLNSTIRFSNHWGMVADVHVRRTNFLADPNFYFVRTGVNYWITNQLSLTAGIGRMWVAPTTANWEHFAVENRIYQQALLTNKLGKIGMLQRIRNEQRWIEKIANDQFTGEYKFSNRIRYLLAINIPIFKSPQFPSLSISNELMVQFGKEIVYNSFDQNRLFLGLRQPISKTLNFDFGYMLSYQQKASGYQYDRIHTLRCFFYYAPDLRKKKI
ncbi:MAG: hypothetical protein CFE25_10920 [Chitinophagaceae bacterium BSSC1]|nr:MAG: hypothetical protein CFE25_10920 [Chitinophagaceae bacterium BSSC1]